MEAALKVLILAAMAAVLSVLVLGLLNMMRGGNANTNQRLMRWRIALQLIAISRDYDGAIFCILLTVVSLISHPALNRPPAHCWI